MGLQKLPASHLEPTRHRLRRLSATAAKPLKQLVGMRWLDENRDCLGVLLEHRECTLHVDLQHDPLPRGHSGGHFGHKGAVPVLPAVNLAALQKLPCRPPPFEFLEGDKVVVEAISLPGTGGTGCGRDARHECGKPREQPPQKRGLAHT